MARLVIAATADADTAAILDDLGAKAGQRIAGKYAGLFEKLLVRLATYPAIGALRPTLGQDVRIGIVSPYVVIHDYDAKADTMTVLRIVHGRRLRAGLADHRLVSNPATRERPEDREAPRTATSPDCRPGPAG